MKDKNFYLLRTDTVHNHFLHNEQLGCKKNFFLNMKKYYERKNLSPFLVLPLTFHVENFDDENWKEFCLEFKKTKEAQPNKVWIVKPG